MEETRTLTRAYSHMGNSFDEKGDSGLGLLLQGFVSFSKLEAYVIVK
jgi:hypothetical protein